MSGFFQVDPEDWAVVREGFSKPWSEEAARIDLKWTLDRIFVWQTFGDRRGLKRWPGERRFSVLWGWTRHRARRFIREELGGQPQPDRKATTKQPLRRGRNSNTGGKSTKSQPKGNHKSRHARNQQTTDDRQADGESRSRDCGQQEEGSSGPHAGRVYPMNSAMDRRGKKQISPFEAFDADLVTTILRVLDRNFENLDELDHEDRSDAFVAAVAAAVKVEGVNGLPNAARWQKREPGYLDVIAILRAVADRNATPREASG